MLRALGKSIFNDLEVKLFQEAGPTMPGEEGISCVVKRVSSPRFQQMGCDLSERADEAGKSLKQKFIAEEKI